jgi:hypothetical protein
VVQSSSSSGRSGIESLRVRLGYATRVNLNTSAANRSVVTFTLMMAVAQVLNVPLPHNAVPHRVRPRKVEVETSCLPSSRCRSTLTAETSLSHFPTLGTIFTKRAHTVRRCCRGPGRALALRTCGRLGGNVVQRRAARTVSLVIRGRISYAAGIGCLGEGRSSPCRSGLNRGPALLGLDWRRGV